MARHIIAACVFCLLCADRIPCQQHFEPSPATTVLENLNLKVFRTSDLSTTTSNANKIPADKYDSMDHNLEFQSNSSQYDNNDLRNAYINEVNFKRLKRHSGGHNHENDAEHSHKNYPETTKEFVKKIFQQYGKRGTMDLNEFERMIKKLGLNRLIGMKEYALDSNNNDNNNNKNNNNNNNNLKTSDQNVNIDNCISDKKLFENIFPEQAIQPKEIYENLVKSNIDLAKQYEPAEPKYEINTNNIYSVCPILLYQMIAPSELERSGCINPSLLDRKPLLAVESEESEKDIFLIWLFSFLSVFFCGLLGLVGVAIIPFMKTKYYKDIIQFLVALAVGTMTGDALLHLIPHSIIGQSEEDMVMKGLVCVLGIIFFYATEHGFTMISEWRKQNAKKSIPSAKVRVVRETDTGSINNSKAGELCKGKYSSYPYCFDEIATETKGDIHHHINEQHNHHNHENNETAEQSLLKTITDNKILKSSADDVENVKDTLPVSVILREHDHVHRGHSHKHGHVHSPPATISAVAWMIILGDGLHNFTDGMAIGAAFSENIAGGLSTSLAVFCHELPHELGDFAILIQAGMSARSAVLYNLMTGLLSFVGMVFGIFFGSSDDASRWMFACAAGLFIYIALVDMMPELTSAHNTIRQMILQLLGLVGGLCSMLLIALYEHDLMNIFNKGGGHGHGHSHGGGHNH